MLTDTIFWIDLLKERYEHRKGAATNFLTRQRNTVLRVSMITWGEIASGFHSPEALGDLWGKVRVLGLPKQVAWEARQIERDLANRHARLGEDDIWIAATARTWGLTLVTRDPAFECVFGLNVQQYY